MFVILYLFGNLAEFHSAIWLSFVRQFGYVSFELRMLNCILTLLQLRIMSFEL